MQAFHFLRPLWLLMYFPLLGMAWYVWRKKQQGLGWNAFCDAHLLPYLLQTRQQARRVSPWFFLLMSGFFMVLSLSGPTWSRLPVPVYHTIQPRVVVLDMSDAMLVDDVLPNRLARAKFKLHDLLQHREAGQFGLVVYTGEPFVVSPLTDDGQTIDALLESLTPDIMPVGGVDLSSALEQAGQLIHQAGFKQGHLLVLSASLPSSEAIGMAKRWAHEGIDTSVIPILKPDSPVNPQFSTLARAGHGQLLPYQDTSRDLDQWLQATESHQHDMAMQANEISVWRDQGRWFLVPALFLIGPVFRRGWLQGMMA